MTQKRIEVEAVLCLVLAEFENQKAGLEEVGVLDHSLDDLITTIKAALEAHKALMSQSDGAQPSGSVEQEPVAWELGAEVYWGDSPELSDYVRKEGTPLYTTPPQRTWVHATEWRGLTDEDLANCDDTELKQALYWEQILKEKNT